MGERIRWIVLYVEEGYFFFRVFAATCGERIIRLVIAGGRRGVPWYCRGRSKSFFFWLIFFFVFGSKPFEIQKFVILSRSG